MGEQKIDNVFLSMMLETLPLNTVLPYPTVEFDCCRTPSDTFDASLNGEMCYSKLLDDKFTSDNLPMISEFCADMEIDEASGDVRSHSESRNDVKILVPDSNSNGNSSTDERSTLNYQLKKRFVNIWERTAMDTVVNISKNDEESTQLTIRVACLESFESLEEKCEDLGLKFNTCLSDTAYEVDMIFGHKLMEGEIYYFVKWKNYTSDSNTWEPECHLTGCKESIEYYHAMRRSKVKVNKKLVHYFVRDLVNRKPYDLLTLTKVCAVSFESSENYVNSLQLTLSQMKQKVKDILTFSDSRISKISNKLFRIMQFSESRKRILINLKEWELEINRKNQSAYISVENNVDLETAPASFEFIHDYINTTVRIPEEPVAFCYCNDCYDNKKSCCPKDSEGHFAYTKHRRLILLPGYPIYECNKLCKCNSDCINRVVQNGQKVKVSIFRTSNDCGWGLKTLEPIEKDEFVLEYLGEIITSEAAEARGHIYDYIGRSYLFDLDYGVDNCCYTVDAGHVGNAAHFINHSCDPNLHVFAVWINQPDPNLPRLAFFAKRKIKRGEELTFDYKMVQKNRFEPQSPMSEGERILCRCNAKNCRKFLF